MGISGEEYLNGKNWATRSYTAEDVYKLVTRDILDVLETVTLRYDDGRVEQVDIFKVNHI